MSAFRGIYLCGYVLCYLHRIQHYDKFLKKDTDLSLTDDIRVLLHLLLEILMFYFYPTKKILAIHIFLHHFGYNFQFFQGTTTSDCLFPASKPLSQSESVVLFTRYDSASVF